MRVLYLHPPRNSQTPGFYAIPVGVFGIINHVKEICDNIIGYNLSLEMSLSDRFCLEQIIHAHQPDLVMIDLHWYEHSCGAMEAVNSVKRVSPKTAVVLGGLTATIFAEQILSEYKSIDFVICGEGEVPFRTLVEQMRLSLPNYFAVPNLAFRFQNGIARTEQSFVKSKVDDFDYVDFSWLKNSRYYLHTTPSGVNSTYSNFWLMFGTGCLFNCSYCGGGREALKKSFGRRRIWMRSATSVARDIIRLKEGGVEIINPTHDFSNFGPSYWEKLFHALEGYHGKIGFYLELFQLPKPEFFKAFAKVADLKKSTVVFSPLVGNEKIRRLNGKLYGNDALIDRLRLCYQTGIRAELGFSKNLPGTTSETALEERKLLQQIEAVYPSIGSYSQEITLDPHSTMALNPREYGIDIQFEKFEDYVSHTGLVGNFKSSNGYSVNG